MNEFKDVIGILGTIFSVLGILPQVVKTIKLKSARDFSLTSLLMTITEFIFWLIYGFCIEATFLIIADSILLLSFCIITYYRITRGG